MMDTTRVHGHWLLTPERVAVHEPTATAVIADLHLGYQEARRRSGDAVPVVDLDDALTPFAKVIQRLDVRRLVIAGDLFERAFCEELWSSLVGWLRDANIELAGVAPGNHDRGLAGAADSVPLYPKGYKLDDWLIVHGHRAHKQAKVVLGHWHPSVPYQGRKCPCYLAGPRDLVLPAYTADAAGTNIAGAPRWRYHRCYVALADEIVEVKLSHPQTANEKAGPWQGRLFRG